MSETLDKIQKVFKVGKILTTVVFVCSIVGVAGSVIGLAGAMIAENISFEIGDLTIRGFMEKEANMSLEQMLMQLVYAAITCAAEIMVAYKALKYFKNEQEAGTPFTFEGAEELKKLGIFSIIVLLAGQLVAGFSIGIMEAIFSDKVVTKDLGAGPSISFGIAFLVLSLIFRYVAEKENSHGQSGEI